MSKLNKGIILNSRMNKKGDISISMVVTIIISVIGFAILLYFFYQLGFTGMVNRETCHQSVVIRATIPTFAGLQTYGTLKCKTDKICITSGLIGGACKEFKDAGGVTTVKVKSVTDIEKTIAQNIIDCWGMMGEGKVSIFSQWVAERYGFGKVYPSCVICSRIAFDLDGLKKAGITEEGLKSVNVENYMQTRLIPNKDVTYYEYLAGKGLAKISIESNLVNIRKAAEKEKAAQASAAAASANTPSATAQPTTSQTAGDLTEGNLKTNLGGMVDSLGTLTPIKNQKEDVKLQAQELAIMFMQITSPTQGGSALHIGTDLLGVGAGAMAIAPSTTIEAASLVKKGCLSGGWVGPAICGGLLVVAGVYQQGSVAANRAVTAGYCGDVETGTEARNGCSVVRTVNYNMSDITQYCSAIENIA